MVEEPLAQLPDSVLHPNPSSQSQGPSGDSVTPSAMLSRASQVAQQFRSNEELEHVRRSEENLFIISSQFCPRLLLKSILSSQLGASVTISGLSVVEIVGC